MRSVNKKETKLITMLRMVLDNIIDLGTVDMDTSSMLCPKQAMNGIELWR